MGRVNTQAKAAFGELLRMWRRSQYVSEYVSEEGAICSQPGTHHRHACHRMKQDEAAEYFTRQCSLDPPMSTRQYRRYENAETGCSWHTYNSMVQAMSAGQTGQTGQEEA